MLQSFVGTVGPKGLIAIRGDGGSSSASQNWPSANVWAILDSGLLAEISIALRQDRPRRALQLLSENAKSLGNL